MYHVQFTSKLLGSNSDTLITNVAGYTGKIDHFTTAAHALQSQGYDVLMYEYSNDVFDSGDSSALSTLIQDIGQDFMQQSKGYAHVRHTGPSLGGGIAWNLQKLDSDRLLPGVFVSAGTNAARLIFRNPLFRKSRAAFIRNGVNETALSEAYAEVLEPPRSPFLLAFGTFDLIIPLREITTKITTFEQRTHTPVKVILRRGAGHTGMIKWYNQHIVELLEQADATLPTN
jgi:hypothetical protein